MLVLCFAFFSLYYCSTKSCLPGFRWSESQGSLAASNHPKPFKPTCSSSGMKRSPIQLVTGYTFFWPMLFWSCLQKWPTTNSEIVCSPVSSTVMMYLKSLLQVEPSTSVDVSRLQQLGECSSSSNAIVIFKVFSSSQMRAMRLTMKRRCGALTWRFGS